MIVQGPSRSMHVRAHRLAKGAGKKNLLKTRMVSNFIVTSSSAGNALSSSTPIVFSTAQFAEQPEFASVFDEVRITGGTLEWAMTGAGNNTVQGVATGIVGILFDSASTFTNNIQNVGALQDHSAVTSVVSLPLTTRSTGEPYHKLHFKMPKGPLSIYNTGETPGSSWFTMETVTQPIIFTVVGNIGALASSITSLSFMVHLNVEFRQRV